MLLYIELIFSAGHALKFYIPGVGIGLNPGIYIYMDRAINLNSKGQEPPPC